MLKDCSYGYVIFYESAGRRYYLLVKQSSSGHWSFPKGHPKQGESPDEARKRELNEETGLKSFKEIRQKYFIDRYQLIRENQPVAKRVVYCLARVKDKVQATIPQNEITDWGWFTRQQATIIFSRTSTGRLLARIDKYLTLNH